MVVVGAGACSAASDNGSPSAPTSTLPTSAASSPSTPSAATATATSAGADTSTASPAARSTAGTAHGSVHVDRQIAADLNVPWGLALLPGGDLLVTSRDTRQVWRINLQSGDRTRLGQIGEASSNGSSGGEGGLLGIAVSPDFSRNHRLFVYYSTDNDNRIALLTYHPDRASGSQLSRPTVILKGIPHGLHHNGGRIAFGPDGMLYASTGESGEPSLSQDKSSLGGKILRMTPAGKPAPGNPVAGSVMWSYGHRNVQGLAWDPAGRLWASEFGDRKADELNLIKPDHNYGWPDTQGKTDDDRFTGPVVEWGTEVDSPSGIAYASGSIWMAALRGERLWRIPLDGTKVVGAPHTPEDFLKDEYGRLRSVLALDDHTLLVTTSNTDNRATPRSGDDRILELTVH